MCCGVCLIGAGDGDSERSTAWSLGFVCGHITQAGRHEEIDEIGVRNDDKSPVPSSCLMPEDGCEVVFGRWIRGLALPLRADRK